MGGDERSAVLDGRVCYRELDRGDEQVSLADGEVYPIPDAPIRLFRSTEGLGQFPLSFCGRYASRRFPGQVYMRQGAEAEPLVEMGQPSLVRGVVPDPVGDLVEELVVGVGEGFGEVLGAVGAQKLRVGAVLTPALVAGADRNAGGVPARPVVSVGGVPVDDARREAPEAGERLEGRSGGLAGRYRAVDERMFGRLAAEVLIGLEFPGARDAADKELRVEIGTAG